uniref:Uncharacterized protein n=1 Tax=Timema monikensis TaxID=170555 RepID=A0A7R9HWK5_9NEOP|nr:unnamed protein product [Timema monikensis]
MAAIHYTQNVEKGQKSETTPEHSGHLLAVSCELETYYKFSGVEKRLTVESGNSSRWKDY